MAVREQSRARVVYRLPEPRRAGAGGGLGLFTVLLLGLVLFLGGLALGRTLFTPSTPRPASQAGDAPAAPPATATQATTAAAGGAATAAPSATGAATSRVGPRRMLDGVPVGYEHSEQGAVASATNYTAVLGGPLVLDPVARRVAIDVLAAPSARSSMQRSYAQAAPLIAKGLGVTGGSADAANVVLRVIPVGWRVEQYDGSTATVAIWATGVGGAINGTPVREGWGVTTIRLTWVDGDWKELGATTTDGPVPIADEQTPTAPSELVPKARAFKEYHYAPGP
jgi:hypothetical protein